MNSHGLIKVKEAVKAPKVKTIRPTVSFCRRLLGTHLHQTCYVIAIMRKLRPKSNCCSLNRSHLRLRRLWRRPRLQFRIRPQFQLRRNLFPIRKAPIPHQKKPIPIPVLIRKAPVASQEVQKANWSRTTLVAWRSPLGNRRLYLLGNPAILPLHCVHVSGSEGDSTSLCLG